jgi:two-component system sensor histidine kinase PilS (NtrC family)
VLLQQLLVNLDADGTGGGYIAAGVLGAVIFIAAMLVRPLANRLIASEALVRRQEVDLANMAQLSHIVPFTSIIVVDAQDRIRLINQSAAEILGNTNAWPDALLGECSPRLLFLLSGWRQHRNAQEIGTFAALDGSRLIQPHFAQLGNMQPAPVLIFLEDTSLLAEKVQQSKLAALGRLSASIAHEIRTPVGAMSMRASCWPRTAPLRPRSAPDGSSATTPSASAASSGTCGFPGAARAEPERLELGGWVNDFWGSSRQTRWGAARLQLPYRRTRPACEAR